MWPSSSRFFPKYLATLPYTIGFTSVVPWGAEEGRGALQTTGINIEAGMHLSSRVTAFVCVRHFQLHKYTVQNGLILKTLNIVLPELNTK